MRQLESRRQSALLRCRESAKSGCEQTEQVAPLLDHLVGAGEQRTCKRNSSHASSAIINGLQSRTSNSGDCKNGDTFGPPSLAIRGLSN
jgi:hypothetical protein